MDSKIYKRMLEKIGDNKGVFKLIGFLYKWLPAFMFICYPAMLGVMFFTKGLHKEFWFMVGVPAGVLAVVTVLRKIINRQRPYEKFATPPLFERDGKGESFPSRHTASAFIIAMSGFVLNMWIGIALLVVSCMIGTTRVLSGVHHITDVVAGGILSVVVGTLFFII